MCSWWYSCSRGSFIRFCFSYLMLIWTRFLLDELDPVVDLFLRFVRQHSHRQVVICDVLPDHTPFFQARVIRGSQKYISFARLCRSSTSWIWRVAISLISASSRPRETLSSKTRYDDHASSNPIDYTEGVSNSQEEWLQRDDKTYVVEGCTRQFDLRKENNPSRSQDMQSKDRWNLRRNRHSPQRSWIFLPPILKIRWLNKLGDGLREEHDPLCLQEESSCRSCSNTPINRY